MKTKYMNEIPKRCQTCRHYLSNWGSSLCMEGAEGLPPTGNYAGPNDPIGHASIHKKDEAIFYKKFIEERNIERGGICEDYREIQGGS